MNPPRIAPLAPPYSQALAELLDKMTPAAAPEVLALFRVFAHNPAMAERASAWGGYLLGRKATLPLRDREVVINRVCARCGAEYEWGVHVAAFGKAAGFDEAQNAAIAAEEPDWSVLTERDRLLVGMVDQLHDTAQVSDTLWRGMQSQWSPPQLLELLMLAGWYHAISYVCNAARVPLENWGARWHAP